MKPFHLVIVLVMTIAFAGRAPAQSIKFTDNTPAKGASTGQITVKGIVDKIDCSKVFMFVWENGKKTPKTGVELAAGVDGKFQVINFTAGTASEYVVLIQATDETTGNVYRLVKTGVQPKE